MVLFVLGMIVEMILYLVQVNESQVALSNISNVDSTFFHTYFLKNNLRVVVLLIAGSLTFGSLTIVNLLINGIFIGAVIKSALTKYTTFELVLLTLPHGIFEIPAIIIAGAAGFKIPYEIVRYLAGKNEQILTKEDIREYLTLALISIILIVIAAFVEAYITPRIAEQFLR